MTTLVLATLIVAAALAAVLAPFFGTRRRTPLPAQPGDDRDGLAAELTRARDAKRSALEDLLALEADYRAGALTEEDYAELKRRDEARALALIARVDALEARLPAPPTPEPEAPTGAAEPMRVPGWMRPLVMGGGAVLLVVIGVAAGYLVSTRGGGDPLAEAAGRGAPAMPGPVMARVQAYRARLAADPRDVQALVGLGQLNLQRGDVSQAIDYFKRALDVDRGQPDALTGIGMILAEAGSFEEALSAFDRALDRNPSQVEALWWKGQVQLYALKDYQGAVASLERAAALLPDGADRARVTQALTEARAAAAAAPQ